MIAILESYRAGLLARPHLWRNVVSGVIVAPNRDGTPRDRRWNLHLAIRRHARLQIAGLTGAVVAVLAVITAQHGIGGLQLATLMAGVMLLAMGAARVGFTSGIDIIMLVGQWNDFFGLKPAPSGVHFHSKLAALVQALPTMHLATTALGGIALLTLIVGTRYFKRCWHRLRLSFL